MKKILSVILTIVMILSVFPLGVFNSLAADASGECGEDVYWFFYEEKATLIISGSGEIDHFKMNKTPWESYNKEIEFIIIADGVTSIGKYAFYGCSSLTNVTIPDSVISIGEDAFSGCSNLESITIPDSVTSIKDGTFWGCSNLTSVTIPYGVTSIGNLAFSGCSSLINVTIPDSVTYIGYDAFLRCSSLTNIIMPNNAESVWVEVFAGCSKITNVAVPYGVTSIGGSSFFGCSALTSVVIPNSVTSIASYVFTDCSSLTDVYYMGTEQGWKNIEINNAGNEPLINATIHYNHTHDSISNIIIAPTCIDEGKSIVTCQVCKTARSEEVIPALGHDFVDGVCVSCGMEKPAFVLGDIDGDEDITLKDVLILRKAVAGILDLEETEFLAADVDGDEDITLKDVLILRKVVAGVLELD